MTSSVQSAVFILAGSAISFCGIGFLALLYSSPATFVTVSTLGSLCLSAFIFARHRQLRGWRMRHEINLPTISSSESAGLDVLSGSYVLVVLGSGGHTKEMLAMMSVNFPSMAYCHRRYLVSRGDVMSLKHLHAFEADVQAKDGEPTNGTFDVRIITRSRNIHQPLWTTPITALQSMMDTLPALLESPFTGHRKRQRFPDAVLTNGPANGFFVALTSYFLKVVHIVPEDAMRILFIESWARIKTLSLTGKLFYYSGISDLFLVQHGNVAKQYGLQDAGFMVVKHDSL